MSEYLPDNKPSTKPRRGTFWLLEYKGEEQVAMIYTAKLFVLPGNPAPIPLTTATMRFQVWPLANESAQIPVRIKRGNTWLSVDLFTLTRSEIEEFFLAKGPGEIRNWLWMFLGYATACRHKLEVGR